MSTLSTKSYRDKYAMDRLDFTLRSKLVAEDVCLVDRSETKTIQTPYLSALTTTVQAIAGTYTPQAFTTNDDTLTVSDEFIASTHAFNFETLLTRVDLYNGLIDELGRSIREKIDNFVINNLCEDGTGTYTTPVGGFTTAANVNTIFANIVSKTSGYATAYEDLYVIVENTDLVGLISAGATNGFMVSDNTLKNGRVANWMGVDVYVVKSGTFTDATVGTKTWTNAGHRVAGVKRLSTYAAPRGIQMEEKGVSGKTGKEIVVYGYIGVKTWTPRSDLTIDITLA